MEYKTINYTNLYLKNNTNVCYLNFSLPSIRPPISFLKNFVKIILTFNKKKIITCDTILFN